MERQNKPPKTSAPGRPHARKLAEQARVGSLNAWITFGDVVAHSRRSHVVFAGRETGSYTAPDGITVPLEIRTTRYFRCSGHPRQYRHHGGINDPDALRAKIPCILRRPAWPAP